MGPARVLGAELDGVDRGENGAGEVRTAWDTLPGKGSVQSGGGRRACGDQRGGSLRTGEARCRGDQANGCVSFPECMEHKTQKQMFGLVMKA